MDIYDPEARLRFCNELYARGEPINLGVWQWGATYCHGQGKIDKPVEASSGIWGSGGDSIAVWSNSRAYPSRAIVALNLQEIECNI